LRSLRQLEAPDGRLTQDGEGSYLIDEPGTRLDTFVVLRTLYGWRIAAPVRHQHLLPHGALRIPNLKPVERARLENLARQYQE
jgi:hypothetical protein